LHTFYIENYTTNFTKVKYYCDSRQKIRQQSQTNCQPNHEGDKDNKSKTYKISNMDKQVIAVRPYI
uniref:hypothetical protein n=1 Tax=Ruminococcus bicirculans (ex Wegman et al. 2014) TaxID=1160721 RepID=UPI004027C085